MMHAWWNVFSVPDIHLLYGEPMSRLLSYFQNRPSTQERWNDLAACAPASAEARHRWESKEPTIDFFELMGWQPVVECEQSLLVFSNLSKPLLEMRHGLRTWTDAYATYQRRALCDLRDQSFSHRGPVAPWMAEDGAGVGVGRTR
jgi:hypothetical protein